MVISKEKEALLKLSDQEIRQILSIAQMLRSAELARERQESAGSAYQQLQELVGLSGVKASIEKILAFKRLQQVAKMRGRIIDTPVLHMKMVGGPGTAKTTVARLLAKIFKENGICSKGTFIEAGRADLIADHVGGTAPLTREKCRQARGGVLFIDEAYSFVEDGKNYCEEFVSTLITEMENTSNDLIVIFAGYEKPMDRFLDSNPGLRSRTPITLRFPDFTAEELLSIAHLMAEDKGFDIEATTDAHLLRNFEVAMKDSNFGNARFVRNAVENAIMTKALGVTYKNGLRLSDEELFSLTERDFQFDSLVQNTSAVRQIGFHL